MAANQINIGMNPTTEEETTRFIKGMLELFERGRIVEPLTDGSGGHAVTIRHEEWLQVYKMAWEAINLTALNVVKQAANCLWQDAHAQAIKAGQQSALEAVQKYADQAKRAIPAGHLDTEQVLAGIAGNLRQMFESGLAQGQKERAAGSVPRVVSARNTVQRNPHTGDIVASLVSYQYEEQPGVNPPPL